MASNFCIKVPSQTVLPCIPPCFPVEPRNTDNIYLQVSASLFRLPTCPLRYLTSTSRPQISLTRHQTSLNMLQICLTRPQMFSQAKVKCLLAKICLQPFTDLKSTPKLHKYCLYWYKSKFQHILPRHPSYFKVIDKINNLS